MSSDMLSRVMLRFNDPDLHMIYAREKSDFFSKAMPVITLMLLLLSASLQIFYTGTEEAEPVLDANGDE